MSLKDKIKELILEGVLLNYIYTPNNNRNGYQGRGWNRRNGYQDRGWNRESHRGNRGQQSHSGPIFDKPVYDDDIFDDIPSLKSSSKVS